MKVHIPSPLHSYTGGQGLVEGKGRTVGEVLADLDARYPGIRFRAVDEQDRIRPHILIYAGGRKVSALKLSISPDEEIHIVAALSGG
jgi:molybdopterin synthase sulfur carrier subunit